MQRIATLARLELTDDETALFADQLTAILAYADDVRRVETTGVAAAIPTTESRLRADELAPSLDRDAVLSQAPDADGAAGLFKVPRVLGS